MFLHREQLARASTSRGEGTVARGHHAWGSNAPRRKYFHTRNVVNARYSAPVQEYMSVHSRTYDRLYTGTSSSTASIAARRNNY